MAQCPKPTQDIELNIKNRQKAIDKIGYGPLNPNEKNEKYWQAKADMWDVSIEEAKKQKCGNCAAFNRSEEMLECIDKGLGETKDSWDVIEAGQLGYCESLDFKCAASRTCDAWIDGNAKSSGAKVSKVDIYLKTVQQLINTIETKADTIKEGSFVEWNASGGKARGRVEHVMKKGTLGVPDSKFSINAEPDNPAVLIRIWRKNNDGEWDETDTLVGHKMSTLSRIEKPGTKSVSLYEMEEKATRKVRDAAYWGVPVGTPIAPGMKPTGPTSPAGRARAVASAGSSSSSKPRTSKPTSKPKPKKRVAVPKPGGDAGDGNKPPKKPRSASGDDKPRKPTRSRDGLAAVRKYEQEQEGLKSPKAQKAGSLIDRISDQIRKDSNDGMVSMNIGINKDMDSFDIDGISDEERRILADKFNSIDRSKFQDRWQGKLDKIAEELGVESDSDGKFKKDENDRYTAAKAEDFSVDAVAKELGGINKDGSPDGSGTLEDPIDVGTDVELAHKLLSEGKHVRMDDTQSVSTLIDKLREVANDAREKGEKAPEYDLCKVSVPKTNLFCIESKGVPRVLMPQFKGAPHEGSFAETRLNDKGEADVEAEFRELLDKMGIKTEMKTVKAADLKASQENLDGGKVAGMAGAMKEGKIPDAPIFVTRDGYIVDGHHRWAAKVALDIEDGVLGDVEMPVEIIDGDIGFILDVANGFADIAGIRRKGLGAAAEGVAKPEGTTGRSGRRVRLDGVGTVTQSDNTQGKSAKADCKPCEGNVY